MKITTQFQKKEISINLMLQQKNLYKGDFQSITMVFRIGSLIIHLISDEIGTMSIPRIISIVVNNFPRISGNFGSGADDNDAKIGRCTIRSNLNSQPGKGKSTKQV